MRAYASPQDDPGALAASDGSGMACVWELEVIDFERRAWLEDVLKARRRRALPRADARRHSPSDARLIQRPRRPHAGAHALCRAPASSWAPGAAADEIGALAARRASRRRTLDLRDRLDHEDLHRDPARRHGARRASSASATACRLTCRRRSSCPRAGVRSRSATSSSHRSGLPALPKRPARTGSDHAAQRPLRRLGRRAARAGDPAHAAAARAPRSAPATRTTASGCSATCSPAGRKRATTNSCGRASPLRSGCGDTGTTVDGGRLATPHRFSGREASHWHFDALAGAGALRSTATDLLGFLRLHASRSDAPLATAARETQRPRAKVGRGHVGLGWIIFPPTRRLPFELLLHEGGTGGYRTFAGLAPSGSWAWWC